MVIEIKKKNELFVSILAPRDIQSEISDSFCFFVPGYQYMPRYKNGIWDGKIRLYDIRSNKFPIGLLVELFKLARNKEWKLIFDKNLKLDTFDTQLEQFIEETLPQLILEPYDYQIDVFLKSIKFNRSLILSPTGCLDENTIIEVLLDNQIISISLKELERIVSQGLTPKILTCSGYEKITNTYRKFSKGLDLCFNDNTSFKCSIKHLMLKDDNWMLANQFVEGDKIGNKVITSIKQLDSQEWVDFTIDADHHSYIYNDITHHNSGKSFIIYLIVRFILKHIPDKILISVPSVNLVKQIKTDFCSYENNRLICDECYELLSGASKTTSRRVVIATWSMLYRQEFDFFTQFNTFICDEAHQADSMALGKIIGMMPHVRYRFGFTGTLDGSKTHELQCQSWFGSLIKSSTTKDLMDKGLLSTLEIESLSIEYSDKDKETAKIFDYQKEIEFITSHQQRNEFLVNLALSQSSNTLLLFNFVEKHGEIIFKMAEKIADEKGKKVFFISGNTGVDKREYIRQTMERENNIVLFASFGTLAVGVNIKNLGNLIFSHPYKARIRTLQSIGRTLRKMEGKEKAVLFDICDNLSIGKHSNITLRHALERLKIYESEGFDISYSHVNFD